jgi:hypothetical protein
MVGSHVDYAPDFASDYSVPDSASDYFAHVDSVDVPELHSHVPLCVPLLVPLVAPLVVP